MHNFIHFASVGNIFSYAQIEIEAVYILSIHKQQVNISCKRHHLVIIAAGHNTRLTHSPTIAPVYTRRKQAIPLLFMSQGQIILRKAEAMGKSVGMAHLGFMAEVQEEMKVS